MPRETMQLKTDVVTPLPAKAWSAGSLSDGVFAVAMTLLVLDLRAPAVEAVHVERRPLAALGALAPRLIMCAMTFHDAWASSGSASRRN